MKIIVLVLLSFFISFISYAQKSDSILIKEIDEHMMYVLGNKNADNNNFKIVSSSYYEVKKKFLIFLEGIHSFDKDFIFKDSTLYAVSHDDDYNGWKKRKFIVKTRRKTFYYKNNKLVAYFISYSGDLEKGDIDGEDINYGYILYFNNNKVIKQDANPQIVLSKEEIEQIIIDSINAKNIALKELE